MLNRRLTLLDQIHMSVGMTEEIMREFAMYSLDVPVSKNFMKGTNKFFISGSERQVKSTESAVFGKAKNLNNDLLLN